MFMEGVDGVKQNEIVYIHAQHNHLHSASNSIYSQN